MLPSGALTGHRFVEETAAITTIDQLLDGLNPAQREAAAHVDGPLLILAGAGSGKTRVITARIAYLLAHGHAQPSNVLAVTFTNKAAAEMRERVATLVGKEAAKALTISTFHSFALRILREYAKEAGLRQDFSVAAASDQRALLRRILGDLDGSTKDAFKPEILAEAIASRRALEAAQPALGNTLPDGLPQTEARSKYETWLPEIQTRYESALRAANSVDFDGLLLLALRLLREQSCVRDALRERFRYLLVDEFQDTNRVQFEMLRHLANPRNNLCVVGDDDQAIYAWRGADPRNILEFHKHFARTTIVRLEQNYRSTQTILDAANAVIANNVTRHQKRLWSEQRKGRAIDLLVTADDEHEAKMAVSWMRTIQKRTAARWRDFALLYRSNTQSRIFELTLRQAGIPYVVLGGQEFFDRAEVRDLVAYLKVIANPRDETALLRVVNMPRRGIGDTTLHRIHEWCATHNRPMLDGLREAATLGLAGREAATGIDDFLRLIAAFRRRMKAEPKNLGEVFGDLVHAIGYRDELERTSKSPEQLDMRWGNVEAIVEALSQYAQGEATPSLRAFLDQSALAKEGDPRTKAERREAAVTLMTIHSAKGLEFPFVFLMGVEDGLLPHEKSLSENGLEEERRLFYVAVTRAQRHLTMFQTQVRNKRGKEKSSLPSRFLAEIPAELINVRQLAERPASSASEPPKHRKSATQPSGTKTA